jgi:hypothetical protein
MKMPQQVEESRVPNLFGLFSEQYLTHLLGPGLLVLVHDELEFSQVVGIVQGVLEVIEGEVGMPMIVYRSPLEEGRIPIACMPFCPRSGWTV